MRAINLVPAEARQGGLSGGKSGGAVYGLIGVLVVILAGTYLFAKSKGEEKTANKDLATVQQSASAYNQVATQYTSFQSSAADVQARIAAVRGLADARFDWAGSLRDLARLVPESVKISTLDASVSPNGSNGGGALRSAIDSPAFSMTGCAPSQEGAAELVTQLQAMRRVTNVTLEYSKRADAQGAADASSCTGFTFAIDIFFAPGSAQDSSSAVPGSASTAQTVSSTTPASTPTTPTSTSGN